MIRVAGVGICVWGSMGGYSYYRYRQRERYLQHPVLRHGLEILRNDNRIQNFCGQDLRPGLFITQREKLEDNWASFEFKLKGSMGTLKVSLVGDWLSHTELQRLNTRQLATVNEIKEAKDDQKRLTKIQQEYVPTDFRDYIIPDKSMFGRAGGDSLQSKKELEVVASFKKQEVQQSLKSEPLKGGDKLWRVSSLVAMHDTDTKLRLRPISERRARSIETEYHKQSLYDLFKEFSQEVEEVAGTSTLRRLTHKFEDLTDEEKRQLARERHKQRYRKGFRARFFQIGTIAGLIMLYVVIGRKYMPKPVVKSVPYHQAISFIENSQKGRQLIGGEGKKLHVLHCQGRIIWIRPKLNFQLLFASQGGKLSKAFVQCEKRATVWELQKVKLLTDGEAVVLLDREQRAVSGNKGARRLAAGN